METNEEQFVLTDENYYSDEANKVYMSLHQYLSFVGHMGVHGCEAKAMALLNGEYSEETTKAMLVGSYVDAWFEGTLDKFKQNHPEIFKKTGDKGLLSEYVGAEKMIARCYQDDFFMEMMGYHVYRETGKMEEFGQHQTIMTAFLFGCEWKIKMDCYVPHGAIVDLKTTSDLHKAWKVDDFGYVSVPEYWGYILQGAIYQKVVEINTGEKLPFYLAFVTKDDEPEICVVGIDQASLDNALNEIEMNMQSVIAVKNGEIPPMRCEKCNYCKKTKKLDSAIHYLDLISE